jgi:hypothetical protein
MTGKRSRKTDVTRAVLETISFIAAVREEPTTL